jgi:hypothetical protein
MTPHTPARMVVVKKEDKEFKLRTLISQALNALAKDPGTTTPSLHVIAISAESPVFRAVVALKDELAAAGIVASLVLVKPETAALRGLGFPATARHLTDARCHEAHELMTLGELTVWTGDCMRRDPSSRDSFELHSANDPVAARRIALSFSKLWAISTPCAAVEDVRAMSLAANLAALPTDAPAPTALTRH